MPQTFLTAEWRKLIMANYAVDPDVLRPYLPAYTELDYWQNTCYVSLVGFLFLRTKVLGVAFPYHQHFEEFNLRFYVRHFDGSQWKRGVVFIKEIVPKPLIARVANVLYKEPYVSFPMRHHWDYQPEAITVEYAWQINQQWDYIRVKASPTGQLLEPGSEEEYITEHYWGYTRIHDSTTSEYEVVHPRWLIHPVQAFDIRCRVEDLYGPAFTPFLSAAPKSVFLAEGSPIAVKTGKQIRRRSVNFPETSPESTSQG